LKEHQVLVFANKSKSKVQEEVKEKGPVASKSLMAGGVVKRLINPEDSFKVNIAFTSVQKKIIINTL
jgi:hypothetical protein